jgi:undecaprenyl-diphosphatase
VDPLIVFVAKYFFLLSILFIAAFWFRSPTSTKIELALRVIVGGAVALLLSQVASALYYDPRPFVVEHITPLIPHAADNGFPSDHALLTSFLAFVVLAYSKRLGSLMLVIALLVGAARVGAHIHHPVDIVGSFVIAAVAAGVVTLFITTDRLSSLRRRMSRNH